MARSVQNLQPLATIVALAGELICASKQQIAAELVEQVSAEFPDYLGARLLALRLDLSHERPREALAGASEILQIDPFNAAALAIELRARRALGESAASAATALDRLAAIAPGHPDLDQESITPTLAGIGFMHLRQGRQLLAQRWLREAIDDEGWPELGAAIAQLQLEGGQVRAALASARVVLELLPDCLPANLVSAQANAELGKLALADKHLQRSRRFDPEFELAERLYARLPVSRLELPLAPALDLPEMLLARAHRALNPSPEPSATADSAPHPVGEYSPPSTRFLPAGEASGEPASDPENVSVAADPHALAATGELARLMEADQWAAVLELLSGSAHLLDAGQFDSLPSEGLARLADELVRVNLPDLAAEAYRLAGLRSVPAAPDAAEGDPRPEN